MAKTVDSLSVQKQLNSMFEKRLQIETQILDTMQQELKVALQMQAVMKDLSADQLVEKLQQGTKAMEEMADKASETGDIGAAAMNKISKESDKAATSTNGVSKAFTGVVNTLKSIITTAAGVAGSMLRIGKAVASIPLAIFKNLLNEAASFVADTSFMEALENIRKEFGSFKEDVSKNIVGAYGAVNHELKAMTGLSVWTVFATPAEQLKYLHDIASKAGSQMHQFGKEIATAGGAIVAFDKGMGIGSENMRAFMNRATVMGTDLQKQLNSAANYALQLGKDFGMSSKTISRDVGMMMKDVRNFGSLTQKEMSVAAVYTRKLGLEIKDLTGLVGQFDNFDKAAESAALLSQAFGASVDAFKMMNEQDPAKRLDELRKSMAATGKSTENMTRQELHLLAQTAGLSDEAAKLAFSTKNQGLSYDEVQKKANKAEDAQLTQAEALKKLADNIERVVRAGGQMHGSFFKMFFAGMERGIKWSKEYMGAMIGVRQALWATHMAGMEVGRAFASSQNVGFGKFMTSFKDTFSTKNVNMIMHGFKTDTGRQMRGVVQELNDAISGKQSFGKAVEHIRETFNTLLQQKDFKKHFDSMIEGGKQMMHFLAKGIGSASGFIAKELVSVLKSVTEFIKDPKEFLRKAGQAADGSKSFGASLVKDFMDSFGDPRVLTDLKDGALKLLTVIGEQLEKMMQDPKVQSVLGKVAKSLIGVLAGPAMIKMIPSLLSPVASAIGRGLLEAGGGSLAAVAGVALAGAALVNVNKKMDDYEKNIDGRFDKTSKKIGAYGGSLVQGLTLGLLPDSMAQMLSESIAKLADGVFDAMREQFGSSFTSKLQTYFGAHINFLSSVGGLLGAIFSGDKAKITAEAEKVGLNLVQLVTAGLDFLVTEAPKLLLELVAVSEQVGGSIAIGIGNALDKVADKMGFFGGAVRLLADYFKTSGKQMQQFGDFLDSIYQKIKDFDITAVLSKKFDQIQLLFLEMSGKILDKVPGPLLSILGLSSNMDSIKANLEKSRLEILDHMQKTAFDAAKAAHDQAKKVSEAKTAADLAAASIVVDAPKSISAAVSSDASIKALEDFNSKIQAPAMMTINVTKDVVKSVNELNSILGDGNAGAMQIGAKLKRFADNSGLGKNSTYEINNKGIQLKLDLKVVMEAGEVEKAIVLRKESILFDALFDKNTALTEEHQGSISKVNAMKGGG